MMLGPLGRCAFGQALGAADDSIPSTSEEPVRGPPTKDLSVSSRFFSTAPCTGSDRAYDPFTLVVRVVTMNESTFLGLLSFIRDGDDAREQLLEFVRSFLRRLADQSRPSHVGDEEPSDLTQESALIVVRNLSNFRGHSLGEFLAWLHDILDGRASNAHRDATRQCRDRRRNVPLDAVAGSLGSDETPFEMAVQAEDAERFRLALAQLPREQRLVFVLRANARLPYREIADLLGDESERTVEATFQQAVVALRRHLRERFNR
jgi:RNA polymerase sigma factor (sigma-70 family)